MAKEKVAELRTRFFADMVDHARTVLIAAGIDAKKADSLARVLPSRMQMAWAGSSIYIPTTDEIYISMRDREIYDNFNGTNHNALATKYRVSVQWIYKIVEAMRVLEQADRQKSLELNDQ